MCMFVSKNKNYGEEVIVNKYNMNTIEIFVAKDFSFLLQYVNPISHVKVKDAFEQGKTHYYIGTYSGECVLLPKEGMVVPYDSVIHVDLHTYFIETIMNHNGIRYYFLRHKDFLNDITFVVQGLDKPTTLTTVCMAFLFGKVVLSTWNVYNFEDIKSRVQSRNIHNNQNVYYQVYTTLWGLRKVKSRFAIKIRSDEIWSDFTEFNKTMKNHPDKLCCSNIYLRKVCHYPYHTSDHVIGGRTIEMLKMFQKAYDLLEENKMFREKWFSGCIWVPEQVLTISYLLMFHKKSELTESNCRSIVLKHFKSVEIISFRNFKITFTHYRPIQRRYRLVKKISGDKYYETRETISIYDYSEKAPKVIELNSLDDL